MGRESAEQDLEQERGGPALPALRDVRRQLVALTRGHRRLLALGGLFTLPAVGLHLALPLVLHAWVEALTAPDGTGALRTPLGLAAAFVAMLLGIGVAEHLQRLHFARFAIGWSRTLRERALAAVTSAPLPEGTSTGELVSILIADVARFKAGVKVFLTYVASNVLLLGGATAVLLATDVALGLIFGGAVLLTVVAAAIGARATYRGYLTFRDLEGALAEAVEEGGHEDVLDVGASSSAAEAAEARINARTTLAAHVLVGLAVLGSLVAGASAIGAGRLDATAMLVFLGYVFLLTKPVVRLARHGARTGKVAACAVRLVQLQEAAGGAAPELPWGTLAVEGLPGADGTRTSLRVEPGGRLLVVGPPGAGKSRLLRTLAGARADGPGAATLGGVDVRRVARPTLERRVGLLEQDVSWQRQPLKRLLDGGDPEAVAVLLRDLGTPWIDDLPDRFGTRLESRQLSFDERRALRLAELLASDRRILLLDDPPAGATELLGAGRGDDRERTWVVVSSAPVAPDAFDQVLELREGRVAFLGSPAAWVEVGRDVALWGVPSGWS